MFHLTAVTSELSENIMRSIIILFAVLAVLDYHFAQGGAQTCPGSGSCNCKFTNNIESLRTLISVEVETLVEQEVAERLANMSSKGAVDNDDCMNMGGSASVAPLLSLITSISNVIASYSCKGLPNCMTSMITKHSISTISCLIIMYLCVKIFFFQ